jgi:stage II sporulation protein D
MGVLQWCAERRGVSSTVRPRGRAWVGLGVAGSLALGALGAGAVGTAGPASAAEPAVSPVGGAWTVRGHGYGHGHGLSQWGAQSRAAAGQSAAQILDFYYPGTGAAATGPRTLRVGLTTWAGTVVTLRSAGVEPLAIDTSARTVAPDQTLVLTRTGTAISGQAVNADRSVAWTEVWTTPPTVSSAGRVALVTPSGTGTVYEGVLRFPVGTGAITPVDVVDLEAYLRGVVPSESYSTWLPAALQAQAVAARGYVLSTLAPTGDWDTCDTTACQVYRGFAVRGAAGALTAVHRASTDAAVTATAGRYRTYQGAPAFTQFSASNGGWTAASTSKYPYLAAAADPFSASTGSATGDDAGTWTAKLSVASVAPKCPSGGTPTSLQPLARDGNGEWGGRLTSLRLTCTTGSVTLTGAGGTRFDLRSNWWILLPAMSNGAVDAKWRATGGASGVLGAPLGPELQTPDGVGSYAQYRSGSVYWSPATGAHEVHGAIRGDWAATGWEAGPLGYPTTDERPTPDGRGRFNHFASGSVYWSKATGAHSVQGAIRDTWARLGWETGPLGYPVQDEWGTPDHVGRWSRFAGGAVYWSRATGAHEVQGAIQAEWGRTGWEAGPLGYPTTDELPTPDGKGRFNHFARGSVYWSRATGAHEVQGAIRDAWAARGWETGPLGYPTSDEHAVAGDPTARASDFTGGTITWSPTTGTTTTLS